MKFIDCDCLVGEPVKPLENGVVPDEKDLLSHVDRLGIERALVRHRLCVDYEPRTGNAACLKEISDNQRLLRVKMVLPEGERPEFDPAASIARMTSEGFRAAWIHPKTAGCPYTLRAWCAGKMLQALEGLRIPTLVEFDSVDPEELYNLLREHPRLPVILLKIPRLGRHRVIWALAESCTNLYPCFGPTFSALDGLKDLCRRIGAERIVWGSAYPDAEGGAAVTNLTYSGLSRREQEQIASSTIERLLEEASRA